MMSEEMQSRLKHFIVDNEDYKKFPYLDTAGKITIGIGYNLSDRGMTDDWINKQYNEDICYHYNNLVNQFPWFLSLDEERQIALLDMCYNLGWKKFLEFKGLIDALSDGDFKRAFYEILNSDYAKQLEKRSARNATIILKGTF